MIIRNDLSIYFADSGTPSLNRLHEHSNGLLRRDGLAKDVDFNTFEQVFISSVAVRRKQILIKSLNYRIPLELFLGYMGENDLSNLV